LGYRRESLTAWQSLTIASVLFHHSNTRLSGQAERILSWIVATPKMHAIHHSIDPAQLQTNFSSGLAIWDHLHGTF
jgi:sterol desaturase/sphingolipid hydroxylase (fatty acid hydroxylase superfamily)